MPVHNRQETSAYRKYKNQKIQVNTYFNRKKKWNIFPLRITSGTVLSTNNGFKPDNSVLSDYGSLDKVITGNDSIIVRWVDSTHQVIKTQGNQFYTETFKVAPYVKGVIYNDVSGLEIGGTNSGTGTTTFSTMQGTRTYSMVVVGEQFKPLDVLKLFVIFDDDNNNIGGEQPNQERQILYLQSLRNLYTNFNNNKVLRQECTFATLNDRLSTSGIAISQFVQYSALGGLYAWPSISHGVVSLNETYLKPVGIKYMNLQLYGGSILNYFNAWGSPIVKGSKAIKQPDGSYEYKRFNVRRLMIAGNNPKTKQPTKNNAGIWSGINDQLTFNSKPETVYDNLQVAKPTGYTNFPDWQTFLKGLEVPLLTEKKFKGMISYDKTNTDLTNPNGLKYDDSEWQIPIPDNPDNTYNTATIPECVQDGDGAITINLSQMPDKTMSNIMNMNAILFQKAIQMPFDFKQYLPFFLNDIPFFGFLNRLLKGLPAGFQITQDSSLSPTLPHFNGFISKFYLTLFDSIYEQKGFISLDIFDQSNSDTLADLLGYAVSSTAMLFKLTDKINIKPWFRNSSSESFTKASTYATTSTYNLAQTPPFDNNNSPNLFLPSGTTTPKETKWLWDVDSLAVDANTPFVNVSLDTEEQWNPTQDGSDPSDIAYIIDMVETNCIGASEISYLAMADNPFDTASSTPIVDELIVSRIKTKTFSSVNGNLFNWMNFHKTSDEDVLENNNKFSYPASIQVPNPSTKPIDVEHDISVILTIPTNDGTFPAIYNYPAQPAHHSLQPNIWRQTNIHNSYSIELINIKYAEFEETLHINNWNDMNKYYQTIRINMDYNFNFLDNNITNGQPQFSANITGQLKDINGTNIGNVGSLVFDIPIQPVHQQKFQDVPFVYQAGDQEWAEESTPPTPQDITLDQIDSLNGNSTIFGFYSNNKQTLQTIDNLGYIPIATDYTYIPNNESNPNFTAELNQSLISFDNTDGSQFKINLSLFLDATGMLTTTIAGGISVANLIQQGSITASKITIIARK